MTFQWILYYPASSLSSISSCVRARHANSSSSHTKPPLSVAPSNYLGEEGQGKRSTGWREKRQEEGRRTHSCVGFEGETTLCRKVKTGKGRGEREAEQVRWLIQKHLNWRYFQFILKDKCYDSNTQKQEMKKWRRKSWLKWDRNGLCIRNLSNPLKITSTVIPR